MGDGAADSAGKGESGVERDAAQLLGGLAHDGVDLGLGGRRSRGHCEGMRWRMRGDWGDIKGLRLEESQEERLR